MAPDEEKKRSDSQNTSAQQAASSQQNKQADQSASLPIAKAKGPWLRSKPSQTSLSPQAFSDTTKQQSHQQISHSPPALSPRKNGSSLQQTSGRPADVLPPLVAQFNPSLVNPYQGSSSDLQSSLLAQGSGGDTVVNPSNTPIITTTTTTTNNTTTTTTTTANITTIKKSSKAESHNYLIPELKGVTDKRIIGHALLAKQLIQAESRGYTTPLIDGKVDAILRGKVMLKEELDEEGKTIPQQEDQNAITRFCKPFMEHYFDTPLLKKNLDQVTENYKKQAEAARKLYDDLGPRDFHRSKDVEKIMKPVIAPIVNYIWGSDNSIKTSNMPAPVLAAMLSLDEEIQAWYKKNGRNDPG